MLISVLASLSLLAFLCASLCGQMGAVSETILKAPGQAVELTLRLVGSMALWSGLMEVAKEAGVTRWLAKLLRPVTGLLFRGVDATSRAMEYITVNLAANLLGMGNAATPSGIAAMQALWQEAGSPETATGPMVTLAVINTASLQLIPTTVALLRSDHGSANPMEILPAVLCCSLLTLTAALTVARLGTGKKQRKKTTR